MGNSDSFVKSPSDSTFTEEEDNHDNHILQDIEKPTFLVNKETVDANMWDGSIVGPVPLPQHPGVSVYTLPVGTRLYHGTGHPNGIDILQRPNFFGNPIAANIYCQRNQCKDGNTAAIGGHLFQYVVYRPVILMALDRCDTLRTVSDYVERHMPDQTEFVDLLEYAFKCARGKRSRHKISDLSDVPRRLSMHMEDSKIFPVFCKVGISGTAAKKIPHQEASKDYPNAMFHSEIYLCRPTEVLRFDGEVRCKYMFNCQLDKMVFAPRWDKGVNRKKVEEDKGNVSKRKRIQ